jgi:hypothetical protein
VEEQGRRIEALEANLDRERRRSDASDDRVRALIRELEARDGRVDGRFQLLSAAMADVRCQCGEDKENAQPSTNGVSVVYFDGVMFD